MKLFAHALLNVLTPAKPAPYHLHSGDDGRAYVCENPHCTSPGFDPADE
ncbi:hypothetical protein VSS74_29710 [Conexibacter stalactiti]|uniref:Uncharacterized protein n=1 Tax=Conexibacter stalactiti TaxID=1940611 RepID=A0ABU4I075_9ACTN|nr:hypothetical protein [Conexibacter stalactiti]MDW5598574.1 hypothetical protein [Conexibacter stalactiti]MEC5039216.1 hypothetical protein [Conexibacter stalactiti]